MISPLISWRQSIARTGFRARGRIGGSAGELGCLGKLLSCRVIDNDSRVPLDKSEGVVKTEISWAVREHRLLCQRRLRTKTLEISPESLCGGVVPPTIDST